MSCHAGLAGGLTQSGPAVGVAGLGHPGSHTLTNESCKRLAAIIC